MIKTIDPHLMTDEHRIKLELLREKFGSSICLQKLRSIKDYAGGKITLTQAINILWDQIK